MGVTSQVSRHLTGVLAQKVLKEGLNLESDRTRATLHQPATKLRTIQLEIISKDVEKRRLRRHINGL